VASLPVASKDQEKGMNLTTFSTEQLHLFVHTVEGISRQLDGISPAHLTQEEQERRETLMEQAFVLGEQLELEIAHRSLVSLQSQLGAEKSANLDIASHALESLQAELQTGERTNP
jgi:hypothetical protein